MSRHLRFGAGGLCALGLVAMAGRALGDDAIWLNAVSGNWADAANWSTDPVFPNNNGTTFDVFITPTGAAYTVTLDAMITIDSLDMPSADATLDLTNNDLVIEFDWTQSASRLLGAGGTGEVTVNGTARFSGGAVLEGVQAFRANGGLEFSGAGLVAEICDTCVDHNLSGTWSDDGTIRLLDGSEFNNNVGATFDITGAGTMEFDDVGVTPTFNNLGTITRRVDAGVTLFDGVAFDNQGTLRVENGTFRSDNAQLSGTTLDRGTWEVVGGSTIDLVGVDIRTIDASVLLDGVGSDIFDSGGGQSAITDLDTIGASGRFDIRSGRDFTTTSGFTLDAGAELAVDGTSTFSVQGGTLSNLVGGVLTDGRFEIGGTLEVNSDIGTIDAGVRLDGVGADIINRATGSTAIETLTDIGSSGILELAGGRDYTADTGITFTVATTGTLLLETDSDFTIPAGSSLGNLAGGAFTGGVFDVRDDATLRIFGGSATSIDADVSLTGPGSRIVDENDVDVFASLDLVDADGTLRLLDGRDLTTVGGLTELGDVTVGSVSAGQGGATLSVGGVFDQMGGTLTLDGGVLASGVNSLNGSLGGNGAVLGPTSAKGNVAPGFSPGEMQFIDGLQIEDDAQGLDTIFFFEIGGLLPIIEHDQIFVGGLLQFVDGDNMAGTLDVQLINGFFPSFGDEFLIIRYEQVIGQFENFVGLDLPGGFQLIPEFRPDGLYLVTVPAPGSMLGLVGLLALSRRRR